MTSTFTPRRRASFLNGGSETSFTPIVRPSRPSLRTRPPAVDDLLGGGSEDDSETSFVPIVRPRNVPPTAPAVPAAPTPGRTAMDVWGRFARGGIGFYSALGSVAGADNPVSGYLDEQANYYDKIISPAERARRDQEAAEVEALGPNAGFIDRLLLKGRQALRDPIGTGAEVAGNVAGSLSLAPAIAATGATSVAGAVGLGVAAGAGAVKQNIYQTIMGAPDADLMADPEYAALRTEQRKSEAEAKAIVASKRQSYVEAAPEITAGAVAGGLTGKYGADPALMSAAGVGAGRAALAELEHAAANASVKGALSGLLKEATTEGAQEGLEQLLGNVGAAAGGAKIDLSQGVPESVAAAGIMGGLSGPGMEVAGGIDARRQLAEMRRQGGEAVAPPSATEPPAAPSDFSRINEAGAAEQAALEASRKQALLEGRSFAPTLQAALGPDIQRAAEDQVYAPLLEQQERNRSAIDDILSARPALPPEIGSDIESIMRERQARSEAQRNLEDQAYRPLIEGDQVTRAAAQSEAQGGLENQYYRELLATPAGAARLVDEFHKAGLSWSQAIKAKDRLKESLLSEAPLDRNGLNGAPMATEGPGGPGGPGTGEVGPAVVAGLEGARALAPAEPGPGTGAVTNGVAVGAEGERGSGLPGGEAAVEQRGPQQESEEAQGNERDSGQVHGGIVAPNSRAGVAARTVAQKIKTAERQIASTLEQLRKAPTARGGAAASYRQALQDKLASHQATLEAAQRQQVAIETLDAIPKEDADWVQTIADNLSAAKVRGVGNREANVEIRSALGANGINPTAFLAAHEAVKSGRATPETVEKYVQMVHLAQGAELDVEGRTLTKANPTGTGGPTAAAAIATETPRSNPEETRLRRLAEEVSIQMRSPQDLRESLARMSSEDVRAIRDRFKDPRAVAAIEERLARPDSDRRGSEPELRAPVGKFLEDHPGTTRAELDAEIRRLRKLSLTDHLSGLGNKRAMEESEKTAGAVSSGDSAGLKWINDTYGHEGGDKFLKMIGDAVSEIANDEGFRDLNIRGFRSGGDEFVIHGDDEGAVQAAADAISEIVSRSKIHVIEQDGSQTTLTGFTLDFGTGKTFSIADAKLKQLRADKEAAGTRNTARGGRPFGLVEEKAPENRVDRTPEQGRDSGDRGPSPAREETNPADSAPQAAVENPPDRGQERPETAPSSLQPPGPALDTVETETRPVEKPAALTKAPALFVQIGNRRYEVKDFADASRRWEGFRDQTFRAGAMGKDLPRPVIVDQDGKEVARIAQNGKIFPPAADWREEVGQEPLYDPSVPVTVDAAAATAETPKSEAQAEAGNYKKGHATINGLRISIENEAGSKRRPEWPALTAHYGYIKDTVGKDKDHVDVFIKPGTSNDYNGPVFVVNQHVNGKFDEHKVMLGYADEKAARRGYLANYSKGWKGLESMAYFPDVDQFRDWLIDGDQKKPAPVVDVEDQAEFEKEPAPRPPTPSARRLVDLVRGLRADTQKEFDDWTARVYKPNSRAIELSGDGPRRQETISISAINEARRRRTLDALTTQLSGLRRAEEMIGSAPEIFEKRLEEVWQRAEAGFKVNPGGFDSPGAMFEYFLINDLLKMQAPRGALTSTPLSRMLRAGFDETKPATPTKDKFAQNTVFTSDAIAKARARVAAKFKGNLNAGIDPELMVDMTTIAGGHIEAGARSFVEFTKAMVADLGEAVRPYLRGLYENIRHYPGFDSKGMTSARDLDELSDRLETSSPPVESTDQRIARLAEAVADQLETDEGIKNNAALRELANEAFMGTRAEGAWGPRDAYDALEMGVSRYIQRHQRDLLRGKPETVLGRLREILQRLPTQTDRTREQTELQQFSTPPTLAYVATRALKIQPGETVLEPSAGTGSLATMASLAGAEVVTNEIAPRRAEILKALGFDKTTMVDAEHLNALLPADIKPDAVLMNPPFSATGGRVANHQTKFGARHVEQALARLKPGGRLVAIVGQGMALDRPTFVDWWRRIASKYDVRANLGIPGEEYGKYGTTFGNQLLVIDKVPGKGLANTRHGAVPSLEEALNVIESLDRPAPGRATLGEGSGEGVRGPGEKPGGGETVAVPGGRPKRPGTARNPRSGPRGSGTGGAVPEVSGKRGQGPALDFSPGSPEGVRGDISDVDRGGPRGERPAVEVEFAPQNLPAPPEREAVGVGFTEARPQRLDTTGMARHPGSIVEPDSLAGVIPPKITYKPMLGDVFARGVVSDLQAEAAIYAGQRHSQTLPTGQRGGFLLGDGTGVGKGRTLASIALDNFRQGRKRTLWVSMKWPLADQARDDLANIGGGHIPLQRLDDRQAASPVEGDGVLFTTYDTFKQPERYEQIRNWLGEDPVILFDEAHQAKNLVSDLGKPTAVGLAVQKIQDDTPNARVVYASATSATEPKDMAYMNRLGLWGAGTAFPTFNDFRAAIELGGVGAMEMASRDMKALGLSVARALSMKDAQFQKTEHMLTREQVEMYDRAATIWQKILENIDEAVAQTNANSRAKGRALSQFYSAMQRFFKQVVSAYKVPTLIKRIDEELAAGKAVVVRLVSTAQGAVEEQVAKAKEEGLDLENLDLTPRDTISDYLIKSFPVALYEDFTDPDTGMTVQRPVLDSDGKPVNDPAAVEMRDALQRELSQITLPDTALDQIISHYGIKRVAEVTGRTKQLLVNETTGKREFVSRSPKSANPAGRDDFKNGTKLILVANDASLTGMDAHASRDIKNQRQRVYVVYETGWSADKELQGLGRVNRTNQASSPIYDLLHTNLPGEKRFMSTIARRLAQVGALSRGDRGAAQAGGLSDYDFENEYGKAAVSKTYSDIDDDIIMKMGFQKNGRVNLKDADRLDVPKFLNRVLALQVPLQEQVFSAFEKNLDAMIAHAKETGQFDEGVTDVKADSIKQVGAPTVVHRDEASGAETNHVELEAKIKTNPTPWAQVGDQSEFFINKQSGRIFAIERRYGYERTNRKSGKVELFYPAERPNGRREYVPASDLAERFSGIRKIDAKGVWDDEFNATPKFRTERLHYLQGATLPIWDRLNAATKDYGYLAVERATTDDGHRIVGVRIPTDAVGDTLKALKIKTKASNSMEVFRGVLENGQAVQLDKGLGLRRVQLRGEPRIEVTGVDARTGSLLADTFKLQEEKIDWKYRYFIPTDEKAAKPILDKFLKAYPTIDAGEETKFAVTARGKSLEEYMADVRAQIPLETVRKAIPGLRWAADPRGFSAKLADGRTLVLSPEPGRALEIRNPAGFEASRRAGGKNEEAVAVGTYTPFGLSSDALIRVAEAAPDGTIEHEGLHFLWDVALTPEEKSALLKKYGGEEESAYAFAKWLTDRNRRPSTWFQKALDWVRRVVHYFRPTWESTFGEAASGRAARRVAGDATGTGTKFATAFHGTPHQFDEFRFDKSTVGTGEEPTEARRPSIRAVPPGPGRPVPIAPMDVDSLASRVIAAADREGTPDDIPLKDLAPPEFHRNMRRVLQVLEPEEAKAFARVYSEFDKEMTEARRTLNWEKGDREALKLMGVYTRDQFLELAQRGVTFNEPGLRAATRFMYEALAEKEKALQELRAAREQGGGGATSEEYRNFVAAALDSTRWMLALRGEQAEAARAFNARKNLKGERSDTEKLLGRLFKDLGGLTEDQAAEVVAVAEAQPEKLPDLVRRMFKPSFWDYVNEYRKASMLSSVRTYGVNFFGNALKQLMTLSEIPFAAGIDSARSLVTGDERQVYAGEVAAARAGLVKYGPAHLKRFIEDTSKAFRGVEEYDPEDSRPFEMQVGVIPGKFGKAVRTIFRLMSAADTFFKGTAEAQALYREAYRRARNEGLTDGNAAKRVDELIAIGEGSDWMDHRVAGMKAKARRAAQYETFTLPANWENSGAFGLMANLTSQAEKKFKPIGVFVPFKGTPANIAYQSFERSPLGLLAVKNRFAELAALKKQADLATTPAEKARLTAQVNAKAAEYVNQFARALMGSAVFSVAVAAALAGNLTGSGPADPDKRRVWQKAGHIPTAVKVGESDWYAYDRFEPAAASVALAANIPQVLSEQGIQNKVGAFVNATQDAWVSKTYLQGLEQLADVMTDPTRYSQKWLRDLTGSFVPAFLGQATESVDPTVRDATGGLLDPLKARIPGLSDELPPVRTGTGEPAERTGRLLGGGPLNPFGFIRQGSSKGDPLYQEFEKAGYAPDAHNRYIMVGVGPTGRKVQHRVDLTPRELELFRRADEAVTARLREIIKRPEWRDMDPTIKKQEFSRLYARGSNRVRAAILPGVAARLRQQLAGGQNAR